MEQFLEQVRSGTMLAAAGEGDNGAADDGNDFGEDGGEDENELVMLQKVVQQTLEKKKAAAAKKQTEVYGEFKAGAEKRIATLDAAIAKDVKDTIALTKKTFSDATDRLASTVTEMEALTAKYQQDMAALWSQYSDQHAALENASMQLKLATEQKKQGIKRRIAALAQENETALTEARKKVESVKGRAAKMPQLAKLLESFM